MEPVLVVEHRTANGHELLQQQLTGRYCSSSSQGRADNAVQNVPTSPTPFKNQRRCFVLCVCVCHELLCVL